VRRLDYGTERLDRLIELPVDLPQGVGRGGAQAKALSLHERAQRGECLLRRRTELREMQRSVALRRTDPANRAPAGIFIEQSDQRRQHALLLGIAAAKGAACLGGGRRHAKLRLGDLSCKLVRIDRLGLILLACRIEAKADLGLDRPVIAARLELPEFAG